MRHALALFLGLVALPVSAQVVDTTPRTLVMSAFAPEWAVLQEGLQDADTLSINGSPFVTGTIEGRDVLLVRSGVGMVNAAMNTQIAINSYNLTEIVFSGIAGGVDPSLTIGDVVIPEQWGQYLDAIMARETEDGFAIPPWMSSDFPNDGMRFVRSQEIMRAGLEEPETRFWFPVDPGLLEVARTVAGDVTPEECVEAGNCLSETPQIVVGGNGVSGSAFVDNADLREWAFETFDARVLDMESAAVAHVAYVNDIPFIAFRSLSDLAGGGEGENEMNTFMGLAAQNSAQVMRSFLAAMD